MQLHYMPKSLQNVLFTALARCNNNQKSTTVLYIATKLAICAIIETVGRCAFNLTIISDMPIYVYTLINNVLIDMDRLE